jgi:hypothetical protein
MSDLIDISAALVASPRPCAPLAGARLRADDAQPRLTSPMTAIAPMAWRDLTGSEKRAFAAAEHQPQDGRTAFAGGTYVTTAHSTRSGPPTSRPPA